MLVSNIKSDFTFEKETYGTITSEYLGYSRTNSLLW